MSKKKTILLTFYFLIMLVLSGCWSRRELNELSIATALGFDKTKEGFLVTVQVVNPSEIAGKFVTPRTEVVTFTSKGDTIFEAIRKLTAESPRRIYLAHIRSIVFGEELARDGISKILDFMSRDDEMRTDFMIVITKNNTANNLLKVQTELERVPANKIYNSLETSERYWGATKVVNLDDLLSSLLSEGKEPVLSGIKVIGNVKQGSKLDNVSDVYPETVINLDSIGVFKGDKLKGWLTPEQSVGYNIITDNLLNAILTLEVDDGLLSIETTQSTTKIDSEVKNGKPTIILNINTEGNVGELQSNLDITQSSVLKRLENDYAKKIKKLVESVIKEAQTEYSSDIFGFGEVIHKKNPAVWKKLKQNWDEEFANLEVNVNVKAEIKDVGTITRSYQKQ